MRFCVFFLSLILLKNTSALRCYKCNLFNLPTPDECLFTDKETKVETCKEDEIYCVAVGFNYHHDDGSLAFTNIRRCGSKYNCDVVKYLHDEKDIRNCHVCTAELCNDGPLIYGLHGGTRPVPPDKPWQSEELGPLEEQHKVDTL